MNISTILNALNCHYALVGELDLYRESDDNSLYKFSSCGEFYAVRISKRISLSDVQTEADTLATLRAHGIKCPVFLKSLNGQSVSTVEGVPLVIMRWLDAEPVKLSLSDWPEEHIIRSAGLQLADFHKRTRDIELPMRTRDMFTEIRRFQSFSEIIVSRTDNGKEILEQLEYLINFAQKYQGEYQIIHNDFRPSNILVHKGKISAMIDFDWMCMGHPLKDVALGAMEWSFPDGAERINTNAFNNFTKGYEGCLQIDRESFSDWMMFAGMSEACTYWTDYVVGSLVDGDRVHLSSHMYKKAIIFSNFKF